jgi:hypothetical protein
VLTCPYCVYTTNRGFNLKRHIGSVHPIHESVLPQNVANLPQNVANLPQNVANPPQNVANPPQNVANPPQNVANTPQNVANTVVGNNSDTQANKTRFTCERCGNDYSRKDSLRRHKEVCLGSGHLSCADCGKTFNNRHAKYHHKKVCTGEREVVADPQTQPSASSIVNNNYNQCEINNNNNIQNNIQINITNFNHENTEYITEEFARKCFDAGVHGLNPMIDKLYFDDEHPENHNVKLKSLNHSLVEIKTEKGWIPYGMQNVIDQIINNSSGTIIFKVQGLGLNLEDDLMKINAIQNINGENKKKIRERTKSRLVLRREMGTAE